MQNGCLGVTVQIVEFDAKAALSLQTRPPLAPHLVKARAQTRA